MTTNLNVQHPVDQTLKQRIADNFGRSAITYHRQADLQWQCAQSLLELIGDYSAHLPSGTILEIGCGTGFITQGLVQRFQQRPLKITDLSVDMLEFCRSQLHISEAQQPWIQFEQLDGEQVPSTENYAAIISGFAFQWFKDPVHSLHQFMDRLQPGGYLFLSFPTADSFPEWRFICDQLQIPCTIHPLPRVDDILSSLSANVQVYINKAMLYTTTHRNVTHFFRSMKAIGAGMSPTQPPLTPRQLKQLIQTWDAQSQPLHIQHCIAFWVIQRCF